MVELKPMELGEILDGAMTLYRRHFGLMLRLGVIALWIPASLNIYLQVTGGPLQHGGLYILAAILQYFCALFLTAGAIQIISDSYLGKVTALRQAVSLGASKILPLFGVGLGKGLLIGLMAGVIGVVAAVAIPAFGSSAGGAGLLVFLVAILAGIWAVAFVACGYAVTTQVVVLEPLDAAFDSFGRSWELTRGFKRKVANVAIVAGIIFNVPVAVVSGMAQGMALSDPGLSAGLAVLAALLPIVLTPLLACVFTLMYYDLRIRREGFDLQVLSQQLVSS
ncbi:MAG TPA: hypothetical protein VNX15_08190 [Gemmatimonadales bacterium]|jgi:hypothetical protein|nr:hypothetical protein [Gemmatimonadales bacterium]